MILLQKLDMICQSVLTGGRYTTGVLVNIVIIIAVMHTAANPFKMQKTQDRSVREKNDGTGFFAR